MHSDIDVCLSMVIFILAYAIGLIFFGPALELYGRGVIWQRLAAADRQRVVFRLESRLWVRQEQGRAFYVSISGRNWRSATSNRSRRSEVRSQAFEHTVQIVLMRRAATYGARP